MDLVTYLARSGERLAAAEMESMQAILTDQVELAPEGKKAGEEVLRLEEAFLARLDEGEAAMYRELERRMANEKRLTLAAVFWRGVKLGIKLGAWGHE